MEDKDKNKEIIYDVIVVGAGPAGLSAAIYGVRAGKSVLMLEQKTYGGQIVTTPEVENYPGIAKISGFEFAMKLYEQATSLGAKLEFEKVIKIEENQSEENQSEENQSEENRMKYVYTENGMYKSKSVILATGSKNRKLGIAREDELVGAGVSYCATCDGAFFRGKDVAVVGGGNTAAEDATFLAGYCSKVYVIHRRDTFRGEANNWKTLKAFSNVEFITNSVVTELVGEEHVEGIVVEDKNVKSKITIPVEAVFVAVGQEPDNKSFANVVELDDYGYIRSDEGCATRTNGIYTAGDCRTKQVRQLTTAVADGAVAALAASAYVTSAYE